MEDLLIHGELGDAVEAYIESKVAQSLLEASKDRNKAFRGRMMNNEVRKKREELKVLIDKYETLKTKGVWLSEIKP